MGVKTSRIGIARNTPVPESVKSAWRAHRRVLAERENVAAPARAGVAATDRSGRASVVPSSATGSRAGVIKRRWRLVLLDDGDRATAAGGGRRGVGAGLRPMVVAVEDFGLRGAAERPVT